MTKYRLIDLFAGAGGLTRGFVNTDRFEPAAAVEIEPVAAATYAANFGDDHVVAEDISTWLRRGDIPPAEVVVGGPPCQGFSSLGRRLHDDPRNDLWREYVKVLRSVKPLYFVVENVPQFLSSHQFTQLMAATRPGGRLSDYELDPNVVDASAFGVPQRRRRAVVIGRHRDLPVLGPLVADGATTTVRDAFRDVTPEVSEVDLPLSTFQFQGLLIPGVFKTRQLHLTRRPTRLSEDRYRHIPPGGNRFDLPDHLLPRCWRQHLRGSTDVMGRLDWDKPSVTIRTEFFKPEKGRYLHPTEHRAITHYEAALLQSFDDEEHAHVWCGSKTAIGRQIGNAVPPKLAEAIARHLLTSLK